MGARAGHTEQMLVLNSSETASLLDPDALREKLRDVMREVSARQVSMPPRIAAEVPERGLLAAMPAYAPSAGLSAKLVSLFPGNAGTALPTHQAVVVVLDPDSGEPLALMDGTSITTLRTAAVSALSAQLLARPESETLAVLGTGVQAQAHAEAVVRVLPIRAIRVAGRDRAKATALAGRLQDSLGLEVQAVDGFAEACAGADVVCAATHSPVPVVVREALEAGVHVTSVGFNTAGREVDSATVVDSLVVVESRETVLAPPPSGCLDLRVPIEEGLVGPGHVHAEIGELLLGTRPGRTSPGQLTLYKSVGIGAEDTAAASLVLEAARRRGIGHEVELG